MKFFALLFFVFYFKGTLCQEFKSQSKIILEEANLVRKLDSIINAASACFSNLKGDSVSSNSTFDTYKTKSLFYGQEGSIRIGQEFCGLKYEFDKESLNSGSDAKAIFNAIRKTLKKKFHHILKFDWGELKNQQSEVDSPFDFVFFGWDKAAPAIRTASFSFHMFITYNPDYLSILLEFVYNKEKVRD